jgi:antitoxin component of MazEF toxin-antitoxin module
MTQKIIKTGNSAAVTIPAEMLKALNLQIGDKTEAKMNFADGSITYVFPEIRQLRLEETKRKKK